MAPIRHVYFPIHLEQALPILVERVGYNPNQEAIDRPEGYPVYHWLQTFRGEGIMRFGGGTVALPPGSGVLLPPGAAHSYEAVGETWETHFLTFGGAAATDMMEALGLNEPILCSWESDSPLTGILEQLLERLTGEEDVFGLEASSGAYRFLVMLHKYGRRKRSSDVSLSLEKLKPLLEWLDEAYSDPAVGLEGMAQVAGGSVRRLNDLFRKTFGVTPYAYLLALRIRKAKEKLISRPNAPVKWISEQVGFRDVSHFTATFRKLTGQPPEQFRRLT